MQSSQHAIKPTTEYPKRNAETVTTNDAKLIDNEVLADNNINDEFNKQSSLS